MKDLKTIPGLELSKAECMSVNAKGWVIAAIGALIAYIADDWADFKQGFSDGWATLEQQ